MKKYSQIFKGIGFMVLGMTILYLVYIRQEKAYQAECALQGISAMDCSLIDKVIYDITHAHFGWIVIIMLLFMCTNIIRALRWQMMLQSLEYKPKFINLLGTIMINYLANLGIPRSGELIRAGILSSHEDIPVEKIFGTIVTDRLFDVIMLAIVIGLAMIAGGPLFTEYITSNTHISFSLNSSQIIAISIMIGLFLLIVVWCTNKYWYMLKEKQWIQRILDMAKGFLQGILSVKKVSNLPLFILYTIGIWFLYYCMMYFSFFTFDATSHLGYTAALIVFVFGSLGILIPTPGGMGSYHFLVAEALTLYGVSAGDGFSFANIVFFSVSVFVSVFFGLLFLIFLPMYNKKISI